MVNHGLISATLFLVAGMVERRTSTGEFALLGGMARGRPALATVLMTIGIITLAVPLSTSFAGEFLILAGVLSQGWAWAAIGAGAMVLAAMYALRLISAVLHQDVGPAVPDSALDLRIGELAVVVPLVLCLLGLSAWPNLISGHAFGGNNATAVIFTPVGSSMALRSTSAIYVCKTAGSTGQCVASDGLKERYDTVVNIDWETAQSAAAGMIYAAGGTVGCVRGSTTAPCGTRYAP
jgi:formate hydrogenlyase subunit 3/multisubunit Na+/H+ antiporter MnhD subunit